MESAVPAFALTVQRQLRDVETTLQRIDQHAESIDEIDIEDVDIDDPASGVSIADLTLTDFRIDLAEYQHDHALPPPEPIPAGRYAVVHAHEDDLPPGVIFCLRAEGDAAQNTAETGYPLGVHFLIHVGDDGAVLLPYTQARRVLDRLKRHCLGRDLPDADACARLDRATRKGQDMRQATRLLSAAIASVVGKSEERAIASLFSTGGTHAMQGEFAGINDFEVIAFLIVLPFSGAIE